MDKKTHPENAAHNDPHQAVACEICLTEIPASVAKTVEGVDYVHYFCGLDCLEKWLRQKTPPATQDKKNN
jgi:hypothetical protein